jgi:hypothetical protein
MAYSIYKSCLQNTKNDPTLAPAQKSGLFYIKLDDFFSYILDGDAKVIAYFFHEAKTVSWPTDQA